MTKHGWIESRTGARGTTYRVRYWSPNASGELIIKSTSFTEWKHGGKKKAESAARLHLADVMTKIAAGTYVLPSDVSLRQLVEQWIAGKETSLNEGTIYTYRSALKHLDPETSAIPIQQLKPMHLHALYGRLRTAGKGTTVTGILHVMINAALKQAVTWEMLARNPASAVPRPAPREPVIRYWSPEESLAFLKTEGGEPYGMIWRLALLTGLRRGELLALRWTDLDFTRKTLTVMRTVTRDRTGKYLIGDRAKTRNSRRTIPLAASLIDPLKAHRSAQRARELAALSWSKADGDLVFTQDDGTLLPAGMITEAFAKAVKRSGLPTITLHGCRHSFATTLLLAGVHPKTAADLLGDTVEMVLRIYSHVTPSAREDAITTLDELMTDAPASDERATT